MFAVINAVLVRPLPYKDPGRLVELHEYHNDRELRNFLSSSRGYYSVNAANFLAWRDQNDVFENIAAIQVVPFGFTMAGLERIEAHRVSASFFPTLGVKPLLGRTFLPEGDTPDGESTSASSVIVCGGEGSGSIRRSSGGPPNWRLLSRTRRTGLLESCLPSFGSTAAPPSIAGLPSSTEIEAWVPFPFLNTPHPATNYSNRDLHVLARLNPAVSLDRAQTEMQTIAQRIEQQFPATLNTGRALESSPMNELLVKDSRAPSVPSARRSRLYRPSDCLLQMWRTCC